MGAFAWDAWGGGMWDSLEKPKKNSNEDLGHLVCQV